MIAVLERGRVKARPAIWTSERWLEYYRANRGLKRPIPWDAVSVPAGELAVLARSLQSWQRGETSDGNHLRAVAARYADETADPAFRDVAELFIGEEARHSDLMGRWLDLSGLGRVEADWGERWFRWLRHGGKDIAGWAAPVIVVEVMAMVYFDAIRKATTCPALKAVCGQILWDEVAHIRFQCERYAATFRRRGPMYRRATMLWQRALFTGATFAIWWGHGEALRAGGYGWRRFWSSAWRGMRRAWELMRPERYSWAPRGSGGPWFESP